ncbi:MAG TPA: polynucleotide adenylyltransferase PcnB [Vulgatibacter sp.]|nr:polynucleotide adenylyltransferase PcnB [Vulgatibacter sp.]
MPTREPKQLEAAAARTSEPRRRYVDDPLQALTALDPHGPPPEIPFERLDTDALKVVHRLRAHGHQAYLVGGCVRDLLLGLQPKDFDVATSAHPGEIRAIFRNCRLIGRRFRLAHIYFHGGKVIETATFRANPHETNGEDGEPPAGDLLITADNVFGTAEEDARRRDFTVNGLFYDVILGRVLDYVGGREDLERRQLRTIGDPDVRMQEDPVRILRAVRFAAKAGLEIEPGTWGAMVRHKEELARCAPPRVLEEIFKLLRSGHSHRCMELLHRMGGLEVLLPPIASFLAQAGPERSAALFESLRLLDEVVRSRPLPDDSVLLSTLLVHLSQHELIKGRQETAPAAAAPEAEHAGEAGEDEGDELEALEEAATGEPLPAEPPEGETPQVPWSISASARTVDELLAELVRSARLPRRIAERARLLLHAQRVLSGARKRRSSPMRFVRQAYFADALLVYELYVLATGHGAESLARWRERLVQAVGAESAASTGVPKAAPEAVAGEVDADAAETTAGRRRRRRGRGRGERSAENGAATAAVDEVVAAAAESLPPEAERRPPPGPADLLPF